MVAGFIPDEVIVLFNWPNPSSRSTALGTTQPLTEVSTRNLPEGKGRQARKAVNLTAICEPTKMWKPRRLTDQWTSTACYRDSFTFYVLSSSNASVRSRMARPIRLSHRICLGSRDSSVDIATGYGLEDTGVGVRVRIWSRIFSSPRCPGRFCDPPSHLCNGCSFPGVNRPGGWSWPYTSS
jgi:hypothetical protein